MPNRLPDYFKNNCLRKANDIHIVKLLYTKSSHIACLLHLRGRLAVKLIFTIYYYYLDSLSGFSLSQQTCLYFELLHRSRLAAGEINCGITIIFLPSCTLGIHMDKTIIDCMLFLFHLGGLWYTLVSWKFHETENFTDYNAVGFVVWSYFSNITILICWPAYWKFKGWLITTYKQLVQKLIIIIMRLLLTIHSCRIIVRCGKVLPRIWALISIFCGWMWKTKEFCGRKQKNHIFLWTAV